jgi:nitrogen fixation NifU-like protein
MMILPPEKQKAILYGLWKGDGTINLERPGARAEYVTTSFDLAHQIKILLLRQHIVASIYTDKEYVKDGVKHRECYRIHIGQRDSLKRMAEILGYSYVPTTRASRDTWFDQDHVYFPITDIRKENYSGKVYNLEVSKDHTYTTEAFCVHNCGDLMEIYIKVKDDMIQDIKFKTFGCGSAIATTSMVTEMVKGKTLDEAMKVTRKDVADELDGLPPVKMHCSNLAADALHDAIKNYRGQQDTKQVQSVDEKPLAVDEIEGVSGFIGKGVHTRIRNLKDFTDVRTLIVHSGDDAISLAIGLTKYTGRVVLLTQGKTIETSAELKKELKQSAVKVLYEGKLLAVMGTNDVEKVRIHDLDEDDKYELFIDAVVLLE